MEAHVTRPRKLPWFRFYTEFVGDPEIQSLAFEDQRHYVMLLCMKGAGILDDEYPTPERRHAVISRGLGLDRVTAVDAIQRLYEAGLVDPTGQPLGWDKRQFITDDSVDRARRYRDRRQANGLTRGSSLGAFRPTLEERDGPGCVYCDSEQNLGIDHMVPIILGGTDALDNLAIACRRCNSGKSGRTPQQAGYAIRRPTAAAAMKRFVASAPVTVKLTPQEVDSDSEKSKSKAALGAPGLGGYVHNSVDNSPPAAAALSQATTAQNHPAPRTNGKAPSLPYSEAIARGVSSSRLVTERVLAEIVRATRHVCREHPDTPPAAVEDAVRQLVLALAQGMSVNVWSYLRKVIPEKAHKLAEDRIEAEARARRNELARDRGRPVIK